MFWNIFVSLCTQKGITPNRACADLNFSTATATSWKKGATPRDTTLLKIADYFNVTTDFLSGKENASPQRSTSEQEMLNTIIDCFDRCNGVYKAKLCTTAQEIAEESQSQVKQTS